MATLKSVSARYARGLIAWGFAALMLLLSALPRGAAAAERDELIDFLRVTGFGVSLDSIALSAEDAPAMLGYEASDFGLQWERLSAEVFDIGLIRERALSILEATLDDDLLTHATGFYGSDLGLRLVEAENVSHMDADSEGKREKGAAILADAGPERQQVLVRLNKAVDAAGISARAVQEIQVRFLMAASHAGVLERELDETILRNLLKGQEEDLRARILEASIAASAYVYRDFSTQELTDYAVALEHPKMQQVYELMNAVQYEIMADRFEALAREMAGLQPAQEL